LHAASALLAYALCGLVLGPLAILALRTHRATLFGQWDEPRQDDALSALKYSASTLSR
jgi:hypothetical protein